MLSGVPDFESLVSGLRLRLPRWECGVWRVDGSDKPGGRVRRSPWEDEELGVAADAALVKPRCDPLELSGAVAW